MISNNQIHLFAKYKSPKQCDSDNLFVAEGCKLAGEVVKEHLAVRTVIALPEWLAANGASLPPSAEVLEASEAALERVSAMRTPNQVWMLVERPSAEQILQRHPQQADSPLKALAVDCIQDPGNMGTILRVADWFGIRRVVCSEDTAGCFSPKVVQASMGSVMRVAVSYIPLDAYLAQCRADGTPVCGAMLDGQSIYRQPLPLGAVLLIGNESRGIAQQLRPLVDHKIKIPNLGGTCESLNAAIATGILCSEFFRQQ